LPDDQPERPDPAQVEIAKGVIAAPQGVHVIHLLPHAAPCYLSAQDVLFDLEGLGRLVAQPDRCREALAVAHRDADRVVGAQAEATVMLAVNLETCHPACQSPVERQEQPHEQRIDPADPLHRWQPGAKGHDRGRQ
jgi:hypothetical protein